MSKVWFVDNNVNYLVKNADLGTCLRGQVHTSSWENQERTDIE